MKRTKKLLSVIAGIFFIVCLFSSSISLSAENNAEVHKLKQKITELEKRIKDLESLLNIYHGQKDNSPNKFYGWLNQKNWRNLKKGMSKEEVKKLLGEPVKTVPGERTIWYYPRAYDSNVSFDENGKLTSWKEP